MNEPDVEVKKRQRPQPSKIVVNAVTPPNKKKQRIEETNGNHHFLSTNKSLQHRAPSQGRPVRRGTKTSLEKDEERKESLAKEIPDTLHPITDEDKFIIHRYLLKLSKIDGRESGSRPSLVNNKTFECRDIIIERIKGRHFQDELKKIGINFLKRRKNKNPVTKSKFYTCKIQFEMDSMKDIVAKIEQLGTAIQPEYSQ